MNINRKVFLGILLILLSGFSLYGQSDSTAPIRLLSKSKMQKAEGNVQKYLSRIAQQGQAMEEIRQGKFTILLNALSNGSYEVQVSRIVAFGNKRVISVFASLYRSAIEYTYTYDPQTQQIKQYHFVCPPNSLTCWANPSDYASFSEFEWKEKFPAKNCSLSVFTSEEYGHEYLQASCFPNRDAALNFAMKFISYAGRDRM